MKGNIVVIVFFISFLVVCFMVDGSYGIVGILGVGRNILKCK